MKNIPSLLAAAYQVALARYCDNQRSAAALDRLNRVRDVQRRASRHYGKPPIAAARCAA